jgi:hypothetical protein
MLRCVRMRKGTVAVSGVTTWMVNQRRERIGKSVKRRIMRQFYKYC